MAISTVHAVAVVLLAVAGQEPPAPGGGFFEEFDSPSVTRDQVDKAFRDRFAGAGSSPWPLGWLGARGLAGGGGFSPTSIASLMKMFGSLGAGGPGTGPAGLAQWLASLRSGSGTVDPAAMRDLLALVSRLNSQREALQSAYPQFDWARFADLASRVGSDPGRLDMWELMQFLEKLKGADGPLGPRDLESIRGLLDQFRGAGLTMPFSPATDMPPAGQPGALSAEALGKLGEILGKLGLTQEQIGKLSEWLKGIPAPGLQGNLAEWASKIDWEKFAPGKWRDWSPRWAVSSFDWLRPRLGFLRNLPSIRIPRIPTASLPGIPSVSFGFSGVTWKEAAAWGALALLPVLAILVYLARDRISQWLGLETRGGPWEQGPVPDLGSLVQLYEREALRVLGPDARFHNIRRIEADMVNALPGQATRRALGILTSLYERWRYLPEAWHPGKGEIRDGMAALGVIASENTA